MNNSHFRLLLFLVCYCLIAPSPAQAQETKPKQFIYVLRLVPRLYSDSAWTKEPGDKTFGIAIFEAKDEAAARAFMESDPAVVAGLMTAELHPFAVALQRKNP